MKLKLKHRISWIALLSAFMAQAEVVSPNSPLYSNAAVAEKLSQDFRRVISHLPILTAIADGDTERLKALCAQSCNPNERDIFGNTPLHEAIGKNDLEVVKLLLEKGADPSIKDGAGKTAFDASRTASYPIREALRVLQQK